MLPKARTNKLLVQELADETLVYDQLRHKAHCLNRTSARIWQQCDGQTGTAELARRLGQPEAIVQLALEQLASRHLLDGAVQPLSGAGRLARRDVLKKLAVAAGTLPLVMTVLAPHAQAATSPDCKSAADCGSTICAPKRCVSGKCVSDAFAVAGTPCTGCDNSGCGGNCECDGTGNCFEAC